MNAASAAVGIIIEQEEKPTPYLLPCTPAPGPIFVTF